jgi:iron complex outermembrane receptor protein
LTTARRLAYKVFHQRHIGFMRSPWAEEADMFRLCSRTLGLAAVLAALFTAPAFAQGTVTGKVVDSAGGVLPGATVTLTDQKTGAMKTATTGADGTFSVDIAPGVYTVTVDLLGFRKGVTRDVTVSGTAAATTEFTLQPRLSEEVTVTALKREETVQNTPVSIAAPSEEVLRARGVENIEGVAANVGGFTVQNLGPAQSQPAMRGVSAGQIVRDQPGVKEQVGVYLDESVVSLSLFTPDLDLFDVGRVEVLRGPQGTLFGSGSASGTVRYITNQPVMGATKWFGEVGANTITDGNQGGSVKLGVNAPMGDKAAFRAAGYFNRLGGWIDAVTPNLSVDKDVNTGYRAGGRAAFRFAPSDRLTITPRFVYQKVKMDGWNRVDVFNILANPFTTTRPPVTLGDREEFNQLDEITTDKFALGDVNLNYDFGGGVSLASITSFTHRDVLVIRDTTSLTASVTGGSIGLPENIYTIDSPLYDATKAKVFTEELRVSGGKDKFRWVTGGFFSHTKRDYGQNLLTTGFEDATGIGTRGLLAPKDSLFFSDLHYKLNQFALFGEGTVSLNDQLELIGGLRFYHFSEDKQQFFDGLFANDDTGTLIVAQPGKTDASGVAPRLILSYKVSDTTRLNAQVSKGFRLGGINDPLNVPICTPEDLATFSGKENWKDETIWDYEIGTKTRIFGNRGSFNVAAFYMDIRDLQATVTAGSCSSRLIFNVPKARSQGLEADFSVAPNIHWDVSFSGSYADSELRSTVPPVAATGIEEGRRLPTVPKFQFSASTTYQWEIGQRSLGYLTGTFQHIGGDRFTQVADPDLGTLDLLSFGANTIGGPLTQATLHYDPILPAYNLLNLRVGMRRENWDLALYANNLTDENARLGFDRERGTRARIFYLVNQPRTIGVTLGFNF